MKFKLGIIGCGNMATAILSGILKSNILSNDEIIISDIDEGKLENFKNKKIVTTTDNKYLSQNSHYILFAVKPQMSETVFKQIEVNDKNFIISIMAGKTTESISKSLKINKICRVMPNTPCLIGQGICALFYHNASSDDINFIDRIFLSLGDIIHIEEKYFDAVTAVSGSGPAYVYYFINALINAGEKLGLSSSESKKLAVKTFIGASNMANESDKTLNQLIESVSSKGGTTVAALGEFDKENISEKIFQGVAAACNRSAELSK